MIILEEGELNASHPRVLKPFGIVIKIIKESKYVN